MKISIKITKEVLEKTKMCGSMYGNVNTKNCAVAYAIREIFPHACMGGTTLRFHADVPVFTSVPTEASSFIRKFDSLVTKPEQRLLLPEFSFDIEVPDSVIESIGIEQAKEIISKSSTLELIES